MTAAWSSPFCARPRPTPREERAASRARTTGAGVASSRASAAPALRCGPLGDTTPAPVNGLDMAGSKLPARN